MSLQWIIERNCEAEFNNYVWKYLKLKVYAIAIDNREEL
jgi:hypothetical protein